MLDYLTAVSGFVIELPIRDGNLLFCLQKMPFTSSLLNFL